MRIGEALFIGAILIGRRLSLLLLATATLFSPQGNKNTLRRPKDLAFNKKVEEARSLAESFREDRSADHPELPAALSWVASGASFAEDWKTLQAYPQETY